MHFLKAIFKKKNAPIKTDVDFWSWFLKKEKRFHKKLRHKKNYESIFIKKVQDKLSELRTGYYLHFNIQEKKTYELIISANSNIKNIVFVEELIASAPKLKGWKFTALKPAAYSKNYQVEAQDFLLNETTLFFQENIRTDYPDLIDISIIHTALSNTDETISPNSLKHFLKNYLGELRFITIDKIQVINKHQANKKLIPISELHDYLIGREKKFIEKNEKHFYNTINDNYNLSHLTLSPNIPCVVIANEKLLSWDKQSSHPWLAIMTIHYDGLHNLGMPNNEDTITINDLEDILFISLPCKNGHVSLGSSMSENKKKLFFACKDFRYVSKVFDKFCLKYKDQFKIEYNIKNDKYWQTFEKYKTTLMN